MVHKSVESKLIAKSCINNSFEVFENKMYLTVLSSYFLMIEGCYILLYCK